MTEAVATKGPLVVVGSSAGGIEALSILVSSLGDRFPAPIVLAQHLDPNRPSQLNSILERRSKLPIVVVSQETRLESGTIYVVPSNRHVAIHDGNVALEQDHGDRPRPSVDLLLSSAADSYGEQLIAVVLTGSGSDGAAGAVRVKEKGGTIIIQNPRTAAFPSMPLALPPTAVDHVVEIDRIGPLIQDILSDTPLREVLPQSEQDKLGDVLGRVTRVAGIDFRQYKPSTLLRRIGRRMAVNRVSTLDDYRVYMDSHPQEMNDLVKSLLIKVTDFFRDPEAFDFLRVHVLPGLIERGRERGRVLRLWSAGCATGEEAYSLSLLVAEMLGLELPEWNVKIFATDVDVDAIAYARRGVYPSSSLDNLPLHLRDRYFEGADQGFRISKALRQMVIFGEQDLSRGVPFPRIDMVTCRNLLIYFKPELQQEVLDLFAYSLHQTHGCLFLGKAETARPSKAVFDLINKRWKVYRCVSGPMPVPLRPAAEAALSILEPKPRTKAKSQPSESLVEEPDAVPVVERPEETDKLQLRRTNEVLLRQIPVGLVMIDRGYKVVGINAVARRLLGIREASMSQDFLHAARGMPYHEVRSAIDRVFHEKSPVLLSQVELEPGIGEPRFVTLQVSLLELAGDLALITATDVTELVQSRRRVEALQAEQEVLSRDLGTSNRKLIETNKELQDANEELQAANEEMMLTQEELQATNEEFEATNEELQATNEELETNNEELQATNEELETTNEELQARGGELQEMTRFLSGEQLRLKEMVDLAPFHILVLRGPGLMIENSSPPTSPLFGAKALGLLFDEVCSDPALESVRLSVRRVYLENKPWTSDRVSITGENGPQLWVFTAVPSANADGRVEGVVLYSENVTQRRLIEEEERLQRLRLMFEHADTAMAMFDASTGRLEHGSERYFELVRRVLRLEPEAARRRTWDDLAFGPPELRGAFREVTRAGIAKRFEEVQVGQAPHVFVYNLRVVPVETEPSAGVRHVLLAATEVTDLVMARKHLEDLDRLKDEFMSLASHELRTPLTPLSAYAELFKQLLAQKERGRDWDARMMDLVNKLRRQVQYLSKLVDDLLDIARLQSGKFALERSPVRLKQVVDVAIEQASMIADHPEIRLDWKAPQDARVEADEVRIVQVMYNLLSNAMRHAGDSERIDLRVTEASKEKRSWVRVEVQDEGPGVPPEQREGLFQRFFQAGSRESRATRAGLGLGLYIADRIVDQHGGKIGVEFPERGTRFWVELPRI